MPCAGAPSDYVGPKRPRCRSKKENGPPAQVLPNPPLWPVSHPSPKVAQVRDRSATLRARAMVDLGVPAWKIDAFPHSPKTLDTLQRRRLAYRRWAASPLPMCTVISFIRLGCKRSALHAPANSSHGHCVQIAGRPGSPPLVGICGGIPTGHCIENQGPGLIGVGARF
jgi:hypothetical protein